jgi:hypothetical protein
MAQPGERNDIEVVVKHISEYIVLGKATRKTVTVRWYRFQKMVAVVASALTGAGIGGISQPLLSAIQGKEGSFEQITKSLAGLPTIILGIGLLLFILIIVVRAVTKEKEIEKKAILSIALYESFDQIERNFRVVLAYPQPLKQLAPIQEDVHTLFRYSGNLMPKRDNYKEDIDSYVKDLIDQLCAHWSSEHARDERR